MVLTTMVRRLPVQPRRGLSAGPYCVPLRPWPRRRRRRRP